MKLFCKILISVLIVVFPLSGIAQKPIAGLIPTFYSITPAIDLIYNGDILSPDQAHQLALSNKVDLSKLNPSQKTNLWSIGKKTQNDLLVDTNYSEVDFHGKLISRLGIYRFSAKTANQQMINFSFGKKIHNFLLRKNLLRKLGYNVPAIQYIKKIKVNFETSIDRDIFIAELADQTMAASERFIIDKTESSVTLIDGVAMEGQNKLYNLALGTFPSHLVQGRRVLRSAYLPLALVDVPESINMMPWQVGRVILHNIKLYHGQDLENTYGPAYEDAKWITRLIGNLSRNDWQEIVVNSFFPKSVEKLLVEKIIARRNHLLELFSMDNPLDFNPLISHLDELKDGELLVDRFEGYVDRFSFGDPESPFSVDEMSYFFLSKGISTTITNAIAQFNSLPFVAVDEQAKVQEHIQNMYQQNGMFYESPLKAWFFPTAKGQLIVSRDIVTGSYMGTNNQVQLVDTIGGFAEAGVFMGIDGLDQIANVSGRGTLNYQRTYSHVKPIKTLKKALKEPFKNMLVPAVLNKLGDAIGDGQDSLAVLSVVKKLKDSLSIGESFIITDSLGGALSLDASMSLTSLMWLDPKLLKAYAQLRASRMVIRRIHITRSDANTIQVYNDLGKSNQLAFTFRLNSYIPILTVSKRWTKGKANTEFFNIPLDDSESKLKLHLGALKAAMIQSKTHALSKVQTPYIVTHDFKEKGRNFNLFIWERNKIHSYDEISITHPKGGTKKFIRQYDAKTKGRNVERFITESISNLVDVLWDQQVFINQTSLMNPGYSIFGKASNEVVVTEAERKQDKVVNKYTMVKILHNGWKAKKHKLLSLINSLNKRFKTKFFKDTALQNTNSILLYQLGIDFYIDQKAHKRLLSLTKEDFKMAMNQSFDDDKALGRINQFMYLIGKVKLNEKNYPKFAMKKLNQLISRIISTYDLKGLKYLFGPNGILVTAKLEGFRQGDEMGDSPLLSDTYGYVKEVSSPLTKIMEKTKIAQGELLLNWMMERAL